MSIKALKLCISLPKSLSNYREIIDQCHDFVLNNSFLKGDFKRLLKFKLVIMELLTNATKHGNTNCQIEINVSNNLISIVKQDTDNTFSFIDLDTQKNCRFPLDDSIVSKNINALLGPNHSIILNVISTTKIEFLEPHFDDSSSVDQIPENFGLKVIRQCSDKFYYTYDVVNSLNLFEVLFQKSNA
jgi:hypothetical protein